MKIGIIETGAPPGDLATRHGSYPDMVRAMLGPDHDYAVHRAFDGDLPDPAAYDALLITGSASGVHDGLPWLEPLADFIRRVPADSAMAGICFGHQIMAHALGGAVDRSPGGWGIGRQLYELAGRMPGLPDSDDIAVIVSHRDQVVVPPPSADIVGGNAHAPYALLAYRDRRAISCQCHPEFTIGYTRELIDAITATDLGADQRADAQRSLAAQDGSNPVADWTRAFLSASR